MVIETERAESTVHAIQAVHIAFTLVGISVQLALNKEALSEQRFQPWRPPVVLFIRTSSAHDSPILGLDFPNSGFLIFDRHLENTEYSVLSLGNFVLKCV